MVRYYALRREADRIVEIEVCRPNAPSGAGMTQEPTGRSWADTFDGERDAKREIGRMNALNNALGG